MSNPQFFCLVDGYHHNVPISQMKFFVPADECAIAGTWIDGKPYQPNKAAFRAALPARWRAAFDRESFFWHRTPRVADHSESGAMCHISLSDRRGKYIATVICLPHVEKESE